MWRKLLFLILPILVAACGHHAQMHPSLATAEALLPERPAAALNVLDSLQRQPAMVTRCDTACWRLLNAEAMALLGVSMGEDGAIDSAYSYFSAADSRSMATRCIVARCRHRLLRGDILAALDDALLLRSASGQNSILPVAYGLLGDICHEAGCERQAISQYQQSLRYAEKVHDARQQIIAANSLSMVYEQLGDADSFLVCQRLIRPLLVKADSSMRAEVLVNQADYLLRRGDEDKAVRILQTVNMQDISRKSSLLMANHYARKGEQRQAEALWFDAAGALSTSVRLEALDSLLRLYPKDALLKDIMLRTMREVPTAHDAEQILSRLAQNDQQLQDNRQRSIILLAAGIIGALALLSAAGVHLYRRRVRRLSESLDIFKAREHHRSTMRQKASLLQAASVVTLREHVQHGAVADEQLWKAVEGDMTEGDASFMDFLNQQTLSDRERRVCLLVRLGFAPGDIACLLGVTPQAVANLRVRLLQKVFGQKGTAKMFDETMKQLSTFVLLLLSVITMSSCSTVKLSESERFMAAFRKDVPFVLDSLTQIGKDRYSFSNAQYINAEADDEIHADGSRMCLRTTFGDPKNLRQDSSVIWRNLFFNRKEQRMVCVDRIVRRGRTVGMIYIMQSESKKYPTIGTYHWDVADPRAMQHTTKTLDDYQKESIARLRAGSMPSQWRLSRSLNQE